MATPPPVGNRAPDLPRSKRYTGAAFQADAADQVLSWGWFLILLVIAAQLPDPAPAFVKVTLILILFYLGVTNAGKLNHLADRFIGGLAA